MCLRSFLSSLSHHTYTCACKVFLKPEIVLKYFIPECQTYSGKQVWTQLSMLNMFPIFRMIILSLPPPNHSYSVTFTYNSAKPDQTFDILPCTCCMSGWKRGGCRVAGKCYRRDQTVCFQSPQNTFPTLSVLLCFELASLGTCFYEIFKRRGPQAT